MYPVASAYLEMLAQYGGRHLWYRQSIRHNSGIPLSGLIHSHLPIFSLPVDGKQEGSGGVNPRMSAHHQ